jgi:hypothetical protein
MPEKAATLGNGKRPIAPTGTVLSVTGAVNDGRAKSIRASASACRIGGGGGDGRIDAGRFSGGGEGRIDGGRVGGTARADGGGGGRAEGGRVGGTGRIGA